MKRSSFFHFCFDSLVWGGSILISPARAEASAAFVPSTTSRLMIGESDRADRSFSMRIGSEDGAPSSTTVFRDLKIDVPIPSTTLSVSVPVAAWYPLDEVRKDGEQGQRATYHHRISVRKIASLLIGLDLGFLADKLLSKNYDIFPLSKGVIDGDRGGVGEADVPIQPPRKCPVVILAHGYLGSRFDLYHIAEALASQGFVCLCPEYPESLAASYESKIKIDDGSDTAKTTVIDRSLITSRLIQYITSCESNKDADGDVGLCISPSSWSIVGHSLGCGTAMRTGDASWTRVCIAGGAVNGNSNSGNRNRGGKGDATLVISSTNDGVVQSNFVDERIPSDFERSILRMDSNENGETKEPLDSILKTKILGRKTSILLTGPNAPSHVSYLSGGTVNAMVDLLSPLLPIAKFLSIPVLDFDKYVESRDWIRSADIVVPRITSFLVQHAAGGRR